ncbi:hypothetical protein LY76DRAFT_115505 [Colletotrichum caudatum]|nr:hypothetical protein LY76DRAFT_115505 [Colletotrichum caudatum]
MPVFDWNSQSTLRAHSLQVIRRETVLAKIRSDWISNPFLIITKKDLARESKHHRHDQVQLGSFGYRAGHDAWRTFPKSSKHGSFGTCGYYFRVFSYCYFDPDQPLPRVVSELFHIKARFYEQLTLTFNQWFASHNTLGFYQTFVHQGCTK